MDNVVVVVGERKPHQLIAQITLSPIAPSSTSPIDESAQANHFFNLFESQLPSGSKWLHKYQQRPIALHQFNSTISHHHHISAANCLVSTLNGQLINLRSISKSNHHQHHHHHQKQLAEFESNKQPFRRGSNSSISTSKPIHPSRPTLSPSKPSAQSIYSDSSKSSSTTSIHSLGHHSIKASPTVSISILPNSSNLHDQLESLQLGHQEYRHQQHSKQPYSPHQTDHHPPKKDPLSPRISESRSISHSPTSSTVSHHRHTTPRNSISHPFESLWQGSSHQHLKLPLSSSLSTIINNPSKPEIPNPFDQLQQHAFLPSPTISDPHTNSPSPFAFSSSTLVNPLPYSDPIISIIIPHAHQGLLPSLHSSSPHNHPHLNNPQNSSFSHIFTLSKFGKCSKVSPLDGHIISSIDICHSEGLIQFDDWIFLTPQEVIVNSDGVENMQTQAKALILCVSPEAQPILLSSADLKVLPINYGNPPTKKYDGFYKTKTWKQSRIDSNKWLIKLLSLSWSKDLRIRELEVSGDAGSPTSWTIHESQEPILLKQFGDELDFGEERHVEMIVDEDRVAVWSADRFWVFERSSTSTFKEQNGQLRTDYISPSGTDRLIPCDDDLIVSMSFLGPFGLLVVSKKHVKLFRSAGMEGSLNGWSEWRVKPIDEARFTLDSSCQFEFAVNNSVVPSCIDKHTDLIKTINLLTVDLDSSSGQRKFSELSFSTAAPNNFRTNDKPGLDEDKTLTLPSNHPSFYPHRRDLYISMPTTLPDKPSPICLTCSIWLENDHRPEILVGDSGGRISVYALNVQSQADPQVESSWKLERLVEEERLAGPISALYADQQWILAGGVSGDLGVWVRQAGQPTSQEVADRDRINKLKLVDRMIIGAVPVERFGRLSDLEDGEDLDGVGVQSRRLSRFVSVMMDGSAVVLSLIGEGMIETLGELSPPDTSLGISDIWSNGPEMMIFYHERELGAQRWLCSESLSAQLGRQEAKLMIEAENAQPLAHKWVRVGLSNCGASTTHEDLVSGSKLSASQIINVSGMPVFNLLSIRMRDFVDSIGLQDGAAIAGRLSLVRLMVSQLLPWGSDPALDDAAEQGLGIRRPSIEERSKILQVINGERDESSGLALCQDHSDWRLSSEHSDTYRLLNLVVLLRVFLNEARYERHASEAIVGLARLASKSTSEVRDEGAAWLDLRILVRYWLDRSTEVREAARLLFGVRLGSMSHEEIEELVASWQDYLPIQEILPRTKNDKDWTFGRKTGTTVQKDIQDGKQHLSPEDKQKEAEKEFEALLLIGLIVSERYKVLSGKVLKNLSIAVFQTISPTGERSEDLSFTRMEMLRAGFEICSKTFEIIQNYIDAIELVRNLFGWATAKDGDLSPELKGVAKYACLHVASVNTPLFMTTLSYDLSISQNPVDRISTMKLVVFMVRKRPLVLHTSLPRLVEAVVKSLDPTQKQMRAQTQTGATVILHELVKTYPSITFHGRAQKLGIGTPEGAIVVYDLKTGTKMEILESFRTPVVATSFSADGQRLVAVSLDEHRIEIWKFAGAAFHLGSFFNFAAQADSLIPRPPAAPSSHSDHQNLGTRKPFKSLSFNVGEEALMSIAGTLEWVRIEWLGDRSCRLRIRQSSITFSC